MPNTNPEQSSPVEGILSAEERDEIFQKLMYEAGYGKIEAGIGICHCAAHELLYHMNACEQELRKAQAQVESVWDALARHGHEHEDWAVIGDSVFTAIKCLNSTEEAMEEELEQAQATIAELQYQPQPLCKWCEKGTPIHEGEHWGPEITIKLSEGRRSELGTPVIRCTRLAHQPQPPSDVKEKVDDELRKVQERASAWCELASAMIHELRMDYAPGALKETVEDTVAAIVKLRRERDEAQTTIAELRRDREVPNG